MSRFSRCPVESGPRVVSTASDRILDRRFSIDAVLKIEIDDIRAEPFQARFAGLDNIFRLTIDDGLALWQPDVAEHGR